MALQNNWLDAVCAKAIDGEGFLAAKRSQSQQLLQSTSWPTRKTESWKYTSLYPLEQKSLLVVGSAKASKVAEPITDVATIDVVIAGDHIVLPEAGLPKGLRLTTFLDATEQEKQLIAEHFSTVKPQKHLFGLVNDVMTENGLFIHVDAGCDIEPLLRIIYSLSDGVQSHARVFCKIEQGANANIIEQINGNAQALLSSFAEYDIADEASLQHYYLALHDRNTLNISGCHFNLHSKSQLSHSVVAFGSELARLDVDIRHCGQFAHAEMNAVYLLQDDNLFDLHSSIEHENPNGTSEENVRCIVADKAVAVFNGRIHIHRDAQKTLAEMNNRNLLLSRDAQINTKPELEIYADDVRCAHGATIAELDEQALYYMQSRGIDEQRAKLMLSFGFINELLDNMPHADIANWLQPLLRQRFEMMHG